MDRTLRLIEGPQTGLPPLESVKAHLRVTHDLEDELIESKWETARQEAENLLNRVIGRQTWELGLPNFTSGLIELPFPPAREVVSVTYRLRDGTVQTLFDSMQEPAVDEGVFALEPDHEPGFIYRLPDQNWPHDPLFPGFPVRIRFTCGLDPVPAPVLDAMMLMTAHLYQDREGVLVGATAMEMPLGIVGLLDQYTFYERFG